jgi:sulfatase modifying factor 1
MKHQPLLATLRKSAKKLALASLSALLTLSAPTQSEAQLIIDTVLVGDAGNPKDAATNFGAVDYEYRIGTTLVTLDQYTAFLNSVAKADPYGIYHTSMAASGAIKSGINRTGESGSYQYTVHGNGSIPVNYVSWYSAARFVNWLHNGATSTASTEVGAYTLNGATTGTIVLKNTDADWWIPSENEWYKAAYYQPESAGGPAGGYWKYATQSNVMPGNTIGSGENQANVRLNNVYAVTGVVGWDGTKEYRTPVGAFSNSSSYYGAFDQSGNLAEWNDAVNGATRGLRGGSFEWDGSFSDKNFRTWQTPETVLGLAGFRVATMPIPEVGTNMLVLMGGLLGIGVNQLRKTRRSSSHKR